MPHDLILELVGYLASLLVLISLVMTSVVKLRVINAIGSLIFSIYALLIHSYPTAVMNGALVLINLYYLWKLSRTRVVFSLADTGWSDGSVKHLLAYYHTDIGTLFPETQVAPEPGDVVYLVYAGTAPAGMLIAAPQGSDLHVKLDYATPEFRDCSVGRFLYGALKDRGFSRLLAPIDGPRHNKYLEEMGFAPAEGGYVKTL